jgi:methionyl-tRNA synthetase
MKSKPFYITTTLPYVNSEPHIGFALEIIRADVVARIKKIQGFDVFFNTGTDEHGIKIYKKAQENNEDAQKYVDRVSEYFRNLLKEDGLNISKDIHFIRTTDDYHKDSAKAFWIKVRENGYIYKKNYKIKYCIGCELEKTDSELIDGKCPLHPLQELELIEEENYFFKFSAFQDKLLNLYRDKDGFVIPDSRYKEIKSFVEKGLEDFSISRLKEKMPWGVEVPDDDKHVMYVWFDALANYISAIGWPHDMENFNKWWNETGGVVQYCGKDNLRQQSAMWQAMLMAAGLNPSKNIIIDGFITGEGGIKMSKSLGNTVSPFDMVREYGTDALRYFVIRELHSFEDGPFTQQMFKDAYNANLANGLGNLVNRVLKMSEKYLGEEKIDETVFINTKNDFKDKVFDIVVQTFDMRQATNLIWDKIQKMDQDIQQKKPFEVAKTDMKKAKSIVRDLIQELIVITDTIEPFLPQTYSLIKTSILANKMPEKPLFLRKD